MVPLHNLSSPSISQTFLPSASPQLYRKCSKSPKLVCVFVREEKQLCAASMASFQDRIRRRQLLALGASVPGSMLFDQTSVSFAAETKKGFLPVTDKKDGYSFLYPFGWQEVVVEGQDKVLKDVIEPLESVSVNMFPTSKQDLRDFGPPQEVAETLIKKVLAPTTQKTKLIEAKEQDFDGRTYYTFEFTAQAPKFIRHALSAICIGNGKLYTLTTGANERRWDKMKDRLYTVVDSFRVFNV
ncbi:phycocyanin alpha-subunit phycocyanobilin lyase [Ancistrocladus abbreviatus]